MNARGTSVLLVSLLLLPVSGVRRCQRTEGDRRWKLNRLVFACLSLSSLPLHVLTCLTCFFRFTCLSLSSSANAFSCHVFPFALGVLCHWQNGRSGGSSVGSFDDGHPWGVTNGDGSAEFPVTMVTLSFLCSGSKSFNANTYTHTPHVQNNDVLRKERGVYHSRMNQGHKRPW